MTRETCEGKWVDNQMQMMYQLPAKKHQKVSNVEDELLSNKIPCSKIALVLIVEEKYHHGRNEVSSSWKLQRLSKRWRNSNLETEEKRTLQIYEAYELAVNWKGKR